MKYILKKLGYEKYNIFEGTIEFLKKILCVNTYFTHTSQKITL